MIIYFADRKMQVLGNAATDLPNGFRLIDDLKIEDVDSGVASFECSILFNKENRLELVEMTKAGNFVLRKFNEENELYTIIDTELDVAKQRIEIYAEDAGLDLLNEVAQKYEATEAHPIAWYINKWIKDSGFQIGTNEIPSLSRKLKWDGEDTVTKRLDSIATEFDNAELSYSYEINGFKTINKYVNIYKSRGKELNEEFRINKNIDNIVVSSSVANLATALYVTGGTAQGGKSSITLSGYKYDDGDIYVDGVYLKSRKAYEKWSRYLFESGTGDGHIVKTFNYNTTSKSELCNRAVSELKKICDVEVNYEIDISKMPETIRIGDRVNLVDDDGALYLSARILKLETSAVDNEKKATIGDYLIKDDGINQKVEDLAAQFAEIAKNRAFYTWIAYADDENGTGISLEPTGKKYIGISANRLNEEPDISDPSEYKWSKIQGDPGSSGVSVTGIIEHYLVSSLSEGITIESEGWVTEYIPTMSSENKYLWNYETFQYSDGSTEDLDPKIIGVYGDQGPSAPSIVKMTKEYYMSSSEIEPKDSVWSPTIPEWTSGFYLWTRWAIQWSEPNLTPITYSEPVLEKSFNDIHELAKTTLDAANEAKESAENAVTQIAQVNTELANAEEELESLVENLETTTEEFAASYATKQELTEVNTDLGILITKNAAELSSTASKVQAIEIDAAQALQDAADAATAAETAKQNAIDAQNKYNTLQQQADATDEELEAAQQAVESAMEAATAAGDAAAAAQSAADSLADRVTAAESNITQMANQISATVQKVESIKVGGRNILLNSSFKSDYDEWTNSPADSHTITIKDGIDCGHVTGALNTGKTIQQSILEKMEPDTEYTVSGWVYTENIVQGTTNYTSSLYMDGYYNNNGTSTWFSIGSIQIPVNTGKWTYMSYTFTSPNETKIKNATVMRFYVYTRDYTGDLYYHSLKLERGNKATDWTPAPEDMATADDIDHIVEEDLVDIRESITNLTLTSDDISATVTTIEEQQEAMDDLMNQVEQITSLLIEDGKVTFDFTTIQQQVENAVEELNRRNRYVAITEDATLGATITIGDSESGMVGRFTKTSLDFLSGDTVIASYANDGLTTENITTNNQLKFGGNWAIRPGTNGNLNDVWIGG